MGTGDKMLGGNLRWTSIPSRGSSNTPSQLHATATGMGQFGSSAVLITYASNKQKINNDYLKAL